MYSILKRGIIDDISSLLHVTPIANIIDIDQIDPYWKNECSFYFSDNKTQQGLALVHSGFLFGGQRGEDRYEGPWGKPWGPKDCSSFVSEITEFNEVVSTIDLLYTYRSGLPKDQQGYIDHTWIGSDIAKAMTARYTPVVVKDPQADIKPGQIVFYRDFSSDDHTHSAGLSGHAALVVGIRHNGNVVAIAYDREMPYMEGFGLQEFPWKSTDTREIMFLSVNKPFMSPVLRTFKNAAKCVQDGF